MGKLVMDEKLYLKQNPLFSGNFLVLTNKSLTNSVFELFIVRNNYFFMKKAR